MTRAVKLRLMAFLVLSAIGITWVSANYLGVVDKILGRGVHLQATLPDSGGLYTGSEVTYRGYKVGQITSMQATPQGVTVGMTLKQGTRLPVDSPMFVHNLSAVGEQYLDFEPPDTKPPYAKNGDTLHGSRASLPISEDVLLTQLSGFVDSVDKDQLSSVISELGLMFRDTANPLQHMVDSGTAFVDEAERHKTDTVNLYETGRTVLATQAKHEQDIRTFSRDLADFSDTLRSSDRDLRTVVQGGPGTLREANALMRGLEPTLPVFLANLTTVNQVLTTNLPALEETLVVFPLVIDSGFTGTPGDGYGHINLQLDNSVAACTQGYIPPSRWRPASDLTDIPPDYSATCKAGPPYDMRGSRYAPQFGSAGSPGHSYRVATYDPRTGASNVGGRHVETRVGRRHTVFGDNSWQWMLMGPERAGE